MDSNQSISNLVNDIEILSRKKVTLTGIKKMVSFDHHEFVLDTTMGPLIIKGDSLEIIKLDIIEGNLSIKGHISSLNYLDSKEKQKSTSLIAKLFK